MEHAQLLRVGSIVDKRGGILGAMKHIKRALPNEKGHIDSTRTPLNYSLTGDASADAIARHAKAQMIIAGIEKPRKNAVMAVEVVFSLPIDRHQQNTHPFFNDCLEWTQKTFVCELLSFYVHLDESAPHAHAIILPLIEGKLQGDKIKGDRANVTRLQDDFFESVAKHHGLIRANNTRLNKAVKQESEALVLKRLESDTVMRSSIWQIVRDDIRNNPFPYAQILGVDIPLNEKKRVKSFLDHKRSKGKGHFIK